MKTSHHLLQLVVSVLLLGCPDENVALPEPTPEQPIQTFDAGTAQPSTPFDSGDQHQNQSHDAGNTTPPPIIDSGGPSDPHTNDAGTSHIEPSYDSGVPHEPLIQDAGAPPTEPPNDSGINHGPSTPDAGQIIEAPLDAGTDLPTTWVADCADDTNGVLNTECIFETLTHNCSTCHLAGTFDYFKDLQTFEDKIVEEPFMIAPGLPESSQFYLLLINQGMPTTNQGLTQMPTYSSFEDLASSGDTHISLNNVYDWILNLEPEVNEINDAGTLENETDAGDLTESEQDIEPTSCTWDSPTTPIDEDDDSHPEADDDMVHELLITISDTHNEVVPGAQVRIIPRLGTTTIVSCDTAAPGITNETGQVLCRIKSSQEGDIGVDVEAYSNIEQGWVLVFDYVALTFSPCVDAKDYFVYEVMGPIFKKCLGCHNAYGLAQEWTQYTGVDIWKGKFEGTPGMIAHNIDIFRQKGSLMFTKPAGLVSTASYGPETYFDLIENHGGGIIIDDEESAILEEMVNRVDKTCPNGETNYDLLARDDIGITRYSDTELYRRATFTFTSHFPEPSEYRSVLGESNFNRSSLIAKTYPAYSLTSNPGSGNGIGDTSNMGSEGDEGDSSGFMPILDRPEFYTRLGEVIEDKLMLQDTKSKSLAGIESLYGRVFTRRNTFNKRFDNNIGNNTSCIPKSDWYSGYADQREALCFPNIPVDITPTQENQAIDLTGDLYAECLARNGCCEEIGNEPATQHLIPKGDTTGACSSYLDADSCNDASGCYYHSIFDSLENDLNRFYNCTDPSGCSIEDGASCLDDDGCGFFTPVGSGENQMDHLRIQYFEPGNPNDKKYGYCFWSNDWPLGDDKGIEFRCYKDAILNWAEDLHLLENNGALGVADIILPVDSPIFYTSQRDFDERFNVSGIVKHLPVPGECRHTFCANGQAWTDRDMQSQSNELANYILKHPEDPYLNNDFSRVLTSEHYVMNPYTAFIMGQDVMQGHRGDNEEKIFEDPMNRNEWITKENLLAEGNTLEDTYDSEWQSHPEHAGWLTMGTFLRRYQNMLTNHNRQRSREVYDIFLDIDILDLVEFTVSANDDLPSNPTFEAFSCRVCHAAMDPLGAHFKNYSWPPPFTNWTYNPRWSDRPYSEDSVDWIGHGVGYYYDLCADGDWSMAEEGETPCVRRPGYKGSLLNLADRPHDTAVNESTEYYGSSETALRSLGEKIVDDERFSLAITRWLHESYLGLNVLSPPQDRHHPNYKEQVMAYMAQAQEIEKVRQVFVSNGNDLRSAITAIITGNLYNIKRVDAADDTIKQALDIASVGGGQRIIPEQLHRRILATTGYPWNYRNNDHWYDSLPMLLETRWYRLMYGGIDYRDVVIREREPTVISTLIARKMSADMACLVAPYEFSYETPGDRKLFQYIDIETLPTSTPEDDVFMGGAESGEIAIRTQLQWLYLNFFGDDLELYDEEIEALYGLFTNILNQGAAFNNTGFYSDAIEQDKADMLAEDVSNIGQMVFTFIIPITYHAMCLNEQASDQLDAGTNTDYWNAINRGVLSFSVIDFNACIKDLSLHVANAAPYFPMDDIFLLEEGDTINNAQDYVGHFHQRGLELLGYSVPDGYQNKDYLKISKQSVLADRSFDCNMLDETQAPLQLPIAEGELDDPFEDVFVECINAYLFVEHLDIVDTYDEAAHVVEQGRQQSQRLAQNCEAKQLFNDRSIDLNNIDGRRRVTTNMDTHGTIAAWQAVLMALLSDYHFLYE